VSRPILGVAVAKKEDGVPRWIQWIDVSRDKIRHAQTDTMCLVRKADQDKVTRAIQQGHIDPSDVYPKPEWRKFLDEFYLQRSPLSHRLCHIIYSQIGDFL
jgi:hypothetical protein